MSEHEHDFGSASTDPSARPNGNGASSYGGPDHHLVPWIRRLELELTGPPGRPGLKVLVDRALEQIGAVKELQAEASAERRAHALMTDALRTDVVGLKTSVDALAKAVTSANKRSENPDWVWPLFAVLVLGILVIAFATANNLGAFDAHKKQRAPVSAHDGND